MAYSVKCALLVVRSLVGMGKPSRGDAGDNVELEACLVASTI
jgi:hypothetical protein